MKVKPSITPDSWEDLVRHQVNSLRFGVVQIVVHESKVVQIEKTEKVRLPLDFPTLSQAPDLIRTNSKNHEK